MKPYGREKKIKGGSSLGSNWKKDCHPKKGYVNWWEAEMNNIVTRSIMKQKIKKQIKEL